MFIAATARTINPKTVDIPGLTAALQRSVLQEQVPTLPPQLRALLRDLGVKLMCALPHILVATSPVGTM